MTIRRLHHEELVRVPADAIASVERMPLTLVVDNVRSLYNVGSIFRTCDGALVREVWLCGYTPHPPRKEIDKTALGATETVPWRHVRDVTEALRALRAQGCAIAALEHTDSSTPIFTLTRADFPMALVVGNEIEGVSHEALALCDRAHDIPMAGVKHSLNVAVATGVAVYECMRVWNGGAA